MQWFRLGLAVAFVALINGLSEYADERYEGIDELRGFEQFLQERQDESDDLLSDVIEEEREEEPFLEMTQYEELGPSDGGQETGGEDEEEDDDEEEERALENLEGIYKRSTTRRKRINGRLEGLLRRWMNERETDLELDTRGINLKAYGNDLDLLGATHPAKKLRAGFPTTTDSCGKVTGVPSWYRNKGNFFPAGIQTFYTQFTEAYGIPIIGSKNVNPAVLKRACYLVKYLLRRYDVRLGVYKLYSRVAMIARSEKTMDLPDYKGLAKSQQQIAYWNTKRGLGATVGLPTNSAGGENQQCSRADKGYYGQDVLVHEATHGIHILGANFMIHGFSRRIGNSYRNAKAKGLWVDTYAARTVFEYYAVAAQIYMSVLGGWKVPVPGGGSRVLKNMAELKSYDATVYNLLEEVYAGGISTFIDRCQYKECKLNQYKLVSSSGKRSSCDKLLKSTDKTEQECAAYTCSQEGNAFQWRAPSYCYPLKCANPNNQELGVTSLPYKVYKLVTPPNFNAAAEIKSSVPAFVNSRYTYKSNTRCANGKRTNKILGPASFTQVQCEKSGGCWSNKCYYPQQDCYDRDVSCPEAAQGGECENNPKLLYKKCPFSCGACNNLNEVTENKFTGMCQNSNLKCILYKNAGYCTNTKYTSYMNNNCCVICNSCKGCKKPVDPLAKLFN